MASIIKVDTIQSTTSNVFFQNSSGTEYARFDSSGNLGIGTNLPTYQTQIYGSGQQTAALTDAGAKGGSLLLNTPTVNAGDGGVLLVGAGGSGAKPFAAVKGLLSDGANNTIGSLAFSTRNATTDTALTERMRIDSSGNVGIGVVPSTWSVGKAVEVGFAGTSLFSTAATQTVVTGNTYYNGAYKYASTSQASYYQQYLGAHSLWSAASGTVGTNVTFTQVLAVGKGNTLVLENGTQTTGTGIAFPATQSASSDANTLDDYEEGTWSAVVAGETGTITSYTVNSATYTKIGDTVYVYLRFTVSNKGTGSNFVVSGLPFTAARELLGIWAETNLLGLTGFMFNAGTGATSFTSRLAGNWAGQCLANGSYTVQATYRV